MIYDLRPVYDVRNSFYGKAQVEVDGDKTTLLSYGTPIVQIQNGEVSKCTDDIISNTTARHVKEFLKQNGVDYDALPGKTASEKLQGLEDADTRNTASWRIYQLKTVFSERESFHGKAQVEVDGDKTTLLSYGTPILGIKDDCLFRIADDSVISNTTASHMKEFILQNDFDLNDIPGKSMKEKLMNLPTEEELDVPTLDDIINEASEISDQVNEGLESRELEEACL